MIIIDVCQAGQLDNNLPAELERDLPSEWMLVVTAPARRDAKVGAFSGAVESSLDELRHSVDATVWTEPYLHWLLQFYEPVVKRLLESNHQPPMVLKFPLRRPWVCLPNPCYDPSRLDRVVTSRGRRDLALLNQDVTARWAVRPPAMGVDAPVFTGRTRLMHELIAFTQGQAASLVVTGRPGCGKSASLVRLVTCSDPSFRAKHADLLAMARPVPPEDAVDVAILATGKASEQIAEQLGGALGIDRPQHGARTALQGWVDGIIAAAEAAERTPTVVIDALDEAADPRAVLMTLLASVNSPENQRLRLLIGVRSSGSPDGAGQATSELAGVATRVLGARQIGVDTNEFWEPDDLIGYVEQLLRQSGSPYHDREAAAPVATVVAAQSGRSYLVAGFTARALAELDEPLAVGDPQLDELLAQSFAELVGQDLRASVPEADDRRRAIHMLRAAAFAEGQGIPVDTIWPLLASAIADDMSLGDRDVAWLLGHQLSRYLVRDTQDGFTVYRPFHNELREVLRAGTSLDADSRRSGLVSEAEAQRRITSKLLSLATWRLA
jgi:hypothetical protein